MQSLKGNKEVMGRRKRFYCITFNLILLAANKGLSEKSL